MAGLIGTSYSRSYNSHGKKYEVPRKPVSSLCELKSGDHIAFHRLNGAFWHHAIVEDIDICQGEIQVIEYTNTVKGFIVDNFIPPTTPGIAMVVRGTYNFRDIEVFLMLHQQCLKTATVVERARSRLGEREYNPLTNNCEHFAMWCKTGGSSSDQVNKVEEMVSKEIRSKGLPKAFTEAAAAKAQKVVAIVRAGGDAVSRGVWGQTVTGARQGVATASTSAIAPIGGAVFAAATEGLFMAYDISCAHADMHAGRISQRECREVTKNRVLTGTSSMAGSTVGSVIGQAVIPVPVLGGTVGAVAGGLTGSFFGMILANSRESLILNKDGGKHFSGPL